jgi:hypothetical protein
MSIKYRDYEIYDEIEEFLKRYYKLSEYPFKI